MRTRPTTTRRDIEPRWQLFDALVTAREDWGLKDRTLSVLHALLSFLPRGERIRLTVFPSNRRLRERLMGMPESTLRRHLARLVAAGLVARRSSPNGKRYRVGQGEETTFGLDLAPFFASGSDILARADRAERLRERLRVLRAKLRLAIARIGEGEGVADLARLLRRKVEPEALEAALATLPPETAVAAARNERDSYSGTESKSPDAETVALTALSEVETLMGQPMRDADAMATTGQECARMIGAHDAWVYAARVRGPAWATMALALLLPRVEWIRRPERYLRTLTERSRAGTFDLVTALARDQRWRRGRHDDGPRPANAG